MSELTPCEYFDQRVMMKTLQKMSMSTKYNDAPVTFLWKSVMFNSAVL
jgi:hypothetical protein